MPGKSISAVRDAFLAKGCGHAVFFDGSDSAMLFQNGEFKVRQGEDKDETCVAGLGIKYNDGTKKNEHAETISLCADRHSHLHV